MQKNLTAPGKIFDPNCKYATAHNNESLPCNGSFLAVSIPDDLQIFQAAGAHVGGVGQKNQLVAFALFHADAAQTILARLGVRLIVVAFLQNDIPAEIDTLVADMNRRAGDKLSHFALVLAAKGTRRLGVLLEARHVRIPFFAHRSLQSFFEHHADLQ